MPHGHLEGFPAAALRPARRAADDRVVDTVLPVGVRRRRTPRDLVLPAVLAAELLCGVALGITRPWVAPPPAPASHAAAVVSEPLPYVVVWQTPAPLPPFPTHAPRDPFRP